MAPEIVYRLNDRDEIVFVNDSWEEFAAANQGEHLAARLVLQRPLWDFVPDPTTRKLYGDVLERVREGRVVRFKFRCDSPACRRLLEMHIERGTGGTVEFRTRTISEEPRPAQTLLDPRAARSEDLVRACGWCKRIEAGGQWLEVEEAVARLRLLERPRLPLMTHGICERCYKEMSGTLS